MAVKAGTSDARIRRIWYLGHRALENEVALTRPPTTMTADIGEACHMLEEMAARLMAFFGKVPSGLGQYESTAEAFSLLYLSTRNVQGVVDLARTTLLLLPSALVVSRAAFEAAIKAAWMIDTDDPFDREARYLAHLESEEKYLEWEARRISKVGISTESTKAREENIKDFRLKMTAMLPPHTRVTGLPTLDQMLTSIGGEKLYAFYNKLSQYTHASHAATWLYRSGGLGTERKHGEFISADQWFLPLRICMLALGQPGRICIHRLGGDEYAYFSMKEEKLIAGILSRIASGHFSLQ